jgi:CDP-diacylglycerol pyrophosphatase
MTLFTLAKSSLILAASIAGLTAPQTSGALRDALWQVVGGLCLGNQRLTASPAPCSYVDTAKGFALLRAGAAHYLLVPTVRIVGIESSDLLSPSAPNYWALAWQSRSYLNDAAGVPVPRTAIGMAVNSADARTQDQLHIHIGCLRRDVIRALQRFEKDDKGGLARPVVLARQRYAVMRIEGESLDDADPFKLLAESSPAARSDMASETLAVAGATFADGTDGFYLLSRRSRGIDAAAAEDLLDYHCKAAKPAS